MRFCFYQAQSRQQNKITLLEKLSRQSDLVYSASKSWLKSILAAKY
jgi:hypothetical protein